jgi:hypothetical protein
MGGSLRKMEVNMDVQFEGQMNNVTKELLSDILAVHNDLGDTMTEIRSCLSNPCANGGTCHATADVCLCAGGFGGDHCEKCAPGFDKKGDACLPDGKKFKALKPYQGSQYVIGTESKNWKDARDACKKVNADLVSTETTGEWDHIFDEIKRVDGAKDHWLGGSGFGKNGGWTWVTGVTIQTDPKGFGAWYSGQPTTNAAMSCMRFTYPNHSSYPKTSNWVDTYCTAKFRYICEY